MGSAGSTRRDVLKRVVTGAGAAGAVAALGPAGLANASSDDQANAELEGGWRARVTITTGPFAGVPFQFLLTYAAGGGMVESSNFDEAPPVPPGYGSWRKSGDRTFKSTYLFFTTAAPGDLNTGWQPNGWGKLKETIRLSSDGKSYESSLTYALYNPEDKPIAGMSGVGTTKARRIAVES